MLSSLGKYLRTLRIQRNELLKDMAEKLTLAPAYLSSIENGKRTPTKKLIDTIIRVYELDEKEKEKIEEAYMLSIEEMHIDMKDANDEQRSLGVAFARKFNNLSEDQINKIKKALGEGDC